MADLRDIGKSLKRFEREALESLAMAQADTGRYMLAAVAAKTPVDTSRCQSNWSLSDRKTGATYNPYPPHATYEHANRGGETLFQVAARAKDESQRIAKRLIAGKRIKPIYIHNPTPYLKYLNKGWSDQAPIGFIKKASEMAYRKKTKEWNKRLGDLLGVAVR